MTTDKTAADLLREFRDDVKLAYGTGEGDEIDEAMMDSPDLAATYGKVVALLDKIDNAS